MAPGDVEVARWSLERDAPVDLAMVDELARVGLAARRSGWSLRIDGMGDELAALIDFSGLSGAVVAGQAPTLIQPSRRAATKRR